MKAGQNQNYDKYIIIKTPGLVKDWCGCSGETKLYPTYGANNFLRTTSSHFHENDDDGVHKLSRS